MRRRFPFVVVLSLLLGLLPLGGAEAKKVVCPKVKALKLKFSEPSYIDQNAAGGEPVSVVAQDGSIIVSAHAGTTHIYKNPMALPGASDFAVEYYNQTLNWRSADGGKTWKRVGLADSGHGPHTLTSTGFSDPDLTMDAGGRIYNVEIDLVNDGVYSSTDDGQSFPFGNALAGAGDRPWLTGGEAEEVYLYVNSPHLLLRSTDGGLTYTNLPEPPVTSKSLVDPLNPDSGLIGPVGLGTIAISDDKAQTWTQFPGGVLGSATQFFGVVAVDKAGNVYQAGAGGYQGADDTTPDGQVSFAYFERATEKWNKTLIEIPTPEGDALWPWVIAGDDGRVAVVWYQSLKGEPEEFYIYAAYTTNAHGTLVKCSDGSKKLVPPQFTVANASDRVIHAGRICLDGTACNENPDFESSDRRLGDFLTVNFDAKGNIFIVSGDTMLRNPVGGPKPVANPIFIKQSSGDRMLLKPMKTRETRCLFPLPSC